MHYRVHLKRLLVILTGLALTPGCNQKLAQPPNVGKDGTVSVQEGLAYLKERSIAWETTMAQKTTKTIGMYASGFRRQGATSITNLVLLHEEPDFAKARSWVAYYRRATISSETLGLLRTHFELCTTAIGASRELAREAVAELMVTKREVTWNEDNKTTTIWVAIDKGDIRLELERHRQEGDSEVLYFFAKRPRGANAKSTDEAR